MNWDKHEIFIVANPHRKSLTKEALDAEEIDIPYHMHLTPDYVVPKTWKPLPRWRYIFDANPKAKNGHLRCQTGHQDCLMMRDTNKIQIMLEDDAVPNRRNWLQLVDVAASLLKDYQVVSLHGRDIKKQDWRGFKHREVGFWTPKRPNSGKVWCLGSLGFIMREDAIQKFIEMNYDGTPMDMLIANKFDSFCVIADSPFNHDRREGSLIE